MYKCTDLSNTERNKERKKRDGFSPRVGTRTVHAKETFHKNGDKIDRIYSREICTQQQPGKKNTLCDYKPQNQTRSQPGFLPNYRTWDHVYSLETLVLTHVDVFKTILRVQQKATNTCRAALGWYPKPDDKQQQNTWALWLIQTWGITWPGIDSVSITWPQGDQAVQTGATIRWWWWSCQLYQTSETPEHPPSQSLWGIWATTESSP